MDEYIGWTYGWVDARMIILRSRGVYAWMDVSRSGSKGSTFEGAFLSRRTDADAS